MKYPAILKSKSESDTRIMLAYDKHQSTCISNDRFDFYCGFNFDTSNAWENITREYLANTYGEVKSKEHAEFIVKLAEVAGFYIGEYNGDEKFFCFRKGWLSFFHSEAVFNDAKEKLITIPLPPKEPEDKEWPQVGDDVVFENKTCDEVKFTEKVEFISKKHIIAGDKHFQRSLYKLTKPPTPEEELAEELREKLKDELSSYISIHDPYDTLFDLTDGILNGEIDGLSYKPK